MRFITRGREVYLSESSPHLSKVNAEYYTVAMKDFHYPVLHYSEEDKTVKLIDHSIFLNKMNRKNSLGSSNKVYEMRFRQNKQDYISDNNQNENKSESNSYTTSKFIYKHIYVPASNQPRRNIKTRFELPPNSHWISLQIEDLRKDDHNGEAIITGWKYGGKDTIEIEFDCCWWRELNWYLILEYENDSLSSNEGNYSSF